MVARGDLGVEPALARVPCAQKTVIEQARIRGKFIITATQMLESMILKPSPTRPEVSDVANAIFDGSDAVTLSAETASGNYPLETVRMMSNIAVETEAFAVHRPFPEPPLGPQPTHAQIIAEAAYHCAVGQCKSDRRLYKLGRNGPADRELPPARGRFSRSAKARTSRSQGVAVSPPCFSYSSSRNPDRCRPKRVPGSQEPNR